jgi:NAD(P)-dependent dehydrogenase (short-subunit alcohol dehydrogenase family)
MNTDFENKIIIVTGATSGIGRATAIKLAAQKGSIMAIGRDCEALEQLKLEIQRTGGIVKTLPADVTVEKNVQNIVQETVKEFGGINVLINAAGIIANGTIENTNLDAWDKMMNTNLRSVFHLMKETVPYLTESRGNIVNVSSVAGLRSFPGVLAYCVSKAAVDQLTRCASLELAPQGIRVNAVNPGVVITNLHRRSGMDETKYSTFLEHSRETHPLGRAGQPEEIAELIGFLASDKAGWITGVTYSIDGGRANTCAR